MTKAAKKKAPSRVRYEEAHPTVSCRISRIVYDKLQKAKEAEGKSFGDILKIGLGIIDERVEEELKIRKKAYDQGYNKGYAEAKRLYMVTYPCNVCGETIELESAKAKEAASESMQEHGWGDSACHKKGR